MNSSRSAFGCFSFNESFFHEYANNVDEDDSEGQENLHRYKISMKVCHKKLIQIMSSVFPFSSDLGPIPGSDQGLARFDVMLPSCCIFTSASLSPFTFIYRHSMYSCRFFLVFLFHATIRWGYSRKDGALGNDIQWEQKVFLKIKNAFLWLSKMRKIQQIMIY